MHCPSAVSAIASFRDHSRFAEQRVDRAAFSHDVRRANRTGNLQCFSVKPLTRSRMCNCCPVWLVSYMSSLHILTNPPRTPRFWNHCSFGSDLQFALCDIDKCILFTAQVKQRNEHSSSEQSAVRILEHLPSKDVQRSGS